MLGRDAGARASRGARSALLAQSRHDVVDAKEHRGGFHRRLDALHLDGVRLPDTQLLHVDDGALVAVDAESASLAGGALRRPLRVLGPELCQGANHVGAAVLREGPGDNLESLADSLERPLLDALNLERLLGDGAAHGHLDRAAAGQQPGIVHDVPGHAHRVLEVALNLVEDVPGSAAEDDGARLGLLAVDEEGEVLLSQLLHLEEARAGADVLLLELLDAVHDGSAGGSRDAVVIRLPHPAKRGDARLAQVVGGEVAESLLRDHNVGLEGGDLRANALDPVLLHLEQHRPVLLLGDLDVGLVLTLLVLEGAVQEHNARVLDPALHPAGRDDVLVHHHSLQHAAVVDATAGDFLNLGVLLDVNLLGAVAVVHRHAQHSLQRELSHERAETAGVLGADAAADDVHELLAVVHVDGKREGIDDLHRRVQRLHVRSDDDGGVDVLLEERLREVEDLAREDDDGGGSVADLLVLRAAELDHGLRRDGEANGEGQRSIVNFLWGWAMSGRATFRPPRFDFFEGTGCGRAPWPRGESRRSREGWRCHRSSARYLGRRRKGLG